MGEEGEEGGELQLVDLDTRRETPRADLARSKKEKALRRPARMHELSHQNGISSGCQDFSEKERKTGTREKMRVEQVDMEHELRITMKACL